MSTVFNVRNIKLPKASRASVIVGALAVVAALVLGYFGLNLYKKMTNTTVTAYFPEVLALYPGDKVLIMGVKVGSIESIEPDYRRVEIVIHQETQHAGDFNALDGLRRGVGHADEIHAGRRAGRIGVEHPFECGEFHRLMEADLARLEVTGEEHDQAAGAAECRRQA